MATGSTATSGRYLGPIAPDLFRLLDLIHRDGLSVSANLAREAAHAVALLASMGWITNIDTGGQTYSRRWQVTPSGLTALHHQGSFPTCSS